MNDEVLRLDAILDALATAREAHRLLPPLPHGMRPPHFRVLNAIYRVRDAEGCARISDLGRATGLLLPNATRAINDLVDQGMLEKSAGVGDRRVVLVRTTEAGERCLHDYVLTFRERLQEEFAAISEADCRALVETIKRVHRILRRLYDDN